MKNFILTILLVLFSVGLTEAQTTNIDARAYVVQSITVDNTSALDFGTVIIGGGKTIQPSDANSGRIELSGGANASVDVDFNLPTQLTDGNGNNIDITFGNQSAGYDTDGGGSVNLFDPNTTLTTSFGNDKLYLYIGGVVDVPVGTPSGMYDNTIEVTVNYN